nr:NADH dehydrogenase subunit 3 [Claraeola sicilis]
MNLMIIISVIIMTIAMIMMMLASTISKKSLNDREKSSPFECGFDPKSSSRLPFSMRFFLITIIFLIFDVEIALLLPMIMVMNISNMGMWMLTSMMLTIVLIIGLYHEWSQGMLNWSN